MYSQIFITKTIKIESDIVEIQTNAHNNIQYYKHLIKVRCKK